MLFWVWHAIQHVELQQCTKQVGQVIKCKGWNGVVFSCVIYAITCLKHYFYDLEVQKNLIDQTVGVTWISCCCFFFFFFLYGALAHFRTMVSPTFSFSEASVEVSRQIQVLRGGVVSPTPTPPTWMTRVSLLSGSSPLTCPAWEPLPVAMLLLA
jgi:hypothetical protein